MKKLVPLLLACIFILGACSSGSSTSSSSGDDSKKSDSNEVTAWAWDPNFNIKALEIAKETYEAGDTDTKIKIVENAQDDIVQKLNTILSSGSTEGLPNIVLIEDYRAQSFLQAYPDMFYELSDYISPDDFASYKIPMTSIEGKQYGVPFDTGVTGVYIRTDYLEEAGYTIGDVKDTDWNTLIDIAIDVKKATGKKFLTLDPNDLGLIRTMIQSAGSWYTKEDGATPNIADNKELKVAFQVYKRLMDEELVQPITDWSQFLAGFNNGEVAAVPTGNWITPSVRAEESQSGKWAVVSQPRLPGVDSSVNASNLGGSSWYVLNIDGKENAAKFLADTFGSNVDFYQKLLTEVGALGTYTPAATGEAYQTKDDFFGGQQIYNDFATWTKNIPQVNYGMNTYAIEDILVVEMQNYLNGKDLEQTLADAQTQAETQIK